MYSLIIAVGIYLVWIYPDTVTLLNLECRGHVLVVNSHFKVIILDDFKTLCLIHQVIQLGVF